MKWSELVAGALVVLTAGGIGVLIHTTFPDPDCIRFEDTHGWLIDRGGKLMSCHEIDDASLDVECRPLEVKPCPK